MNKFIFGFVVLALGVVVGWVVLPAQALPEAVPINDVQVTPPLEESVTQAPQPATTSATVRYTDAGFVPESVTVTAGSTVTFVNESSSGMWVASAMHPTHSLLPGFDALQSFVRGGTYEYMFTKVGTWKYHNHVNPTAVGTIIVQ